MKKLYTSIVAVLLTAITFAQTPEKMSYQAVIRDANDHLLTEQPVGMQISILQGSASGAAVFVETHSPTSNVNGLISLEIGTGTPVSGEFASIDWSDDLYFIKTETDPTAAGGSSYTITGVSQLLSVPYALHARTAESLSESIPETDPVFSGSEAVNISAGDISNLANLSGTNSGDQDVSSLADKSALGDSTALLRSEIPDVSIYLLNEIDGSVTNEIQDLQGVLEAGNDANANSLVNISQITIGASDPTPGTALDISSTQGALLLPRMTHTQREAIVPLEGMIIYNTDVHKFQGYGGADGPHVLDQQLTTINNGGGEDRAQSFTAGISGNLSAIELPFNAMSGSTDVNITIREGDGTTGPVLFTQTLTILGGEMTWYPIEISDVSVEAGNSYTIHVNEASPGECMDLMCYDWGMDTSGDNYTGGLFYYQGTPYSGGVYDCAFKTYVSQAGIGWVDLH